MDIPERIKERFLSRVKKTNTCWLWSSGLDLQGYGRIQFREKGKKIYWRAHRLSYIIHKGPIENGLFVCHDCDNPACVNPDHLFLGTNEENMQDMKDKGRATWGQKSKHAKLTNAQVVEIRERHSKGEKQSTLAKEFGVAKSTMSYIINLKTFTHL